MNFFIIGLSFLGCAGICLGPVGGFAGTVDIAIEAGTRKAFGMKKSKREKRHDFWLYLGIICSILGAIFLAIELILSLLILL